MKEDEEEGEEEKGDKEKEGRVLIKCIDRVCS